MESQIMVVDDHPVVRLGVRQALSVIPGLQIISEVASGEEAIAALKQLTPDLLVLDLSLPEMSGEDLLRYVKSYSPRTRILVLTGTDEAYRIQEVVQSGADGLLLKDEMLTHIGEAVQSLLSGQGWFSRQIAMQILSWLQYKEDKNQSQISLREQTVLRLISLGKSNQQIAVELHLSIKTIESEISSIFRKLNVDSRIAAAVLAVRTKII